MAVDHDRRRDASWEVRLGALADALAINGPHWAARTCDALVRVTPREEQVIRMWFGIDRNSTAPATLKQIGERFALSTERVRQVAHRAIERARKREALSR